MNLTEEHYKEIEDMAALFFSPAEIALNVGLAEDETELFKTVVELRNLAYPMANAYFRGRLSAEIELRKAIKQAATNGSNPAQQMMLTFLTQTRL